MTRSCPHCNQGSPLHFRVADTNRRISHEEFNYWRCPRCGLIFLSPIPANLGEYYAGDYYSIPSSLEQLASQAEAHRFKVEIVRRFLSGGRILEIGPGYGGFAYLAKQAGFEVTALEMDSLCCHFLREVVGVEAVNTVDVAAALAGAEPCNAVVLWNVLEHLIDPWAILDAAVARLLPGGILAISAPNPQSLQFRILGRYWYHLDAPRHVALVPAPLLMRHMQATGMETVLAVTEDMGGQGLDRMGWQASLMKISTQPLLKYLMRKIGGLAAMLLKPLDRRDWLGSTYTIVFRKPCGLDSPSPPDAGRYPPSFV